VAPPTEWAVEVMLLGASLMLLQAAQLSVGAGGTFRSIQAAVDAARPGDTVRVAAGVYHEHPVIDSPVVLLGAPGAVIDGDGRGSVLTVTAPATVRGFTIRSSGADQSREHAGIMVRESDGVVIADNRFEDVLFGIYVKQSDSVVIRGNQIVGKNLAMPLRGDGIRLWYSHDGRVADNELRHVRDLVIWFSNGTQVHGNLVRDSRYGLHYMYSDRNRFEENRFIANHVGAFIMYSDDITFRGNLFADARGTTGRGLGFKDADGITAVDNVLVKNAIGISIDNSPTSVGVVNHFRDNVIAYNDVGVWMLPSVHDNHFSGNQFIDNVQPVGVSGGGTALANAWRDNYWSEYAGFDEDGDGHGDTPFVFERLSDDLLAKHEPLLVYNLSLATSALNTLSRVFPLLQPQPIVVDSLPRTEWTLSTGGEADGGRPLAAAGFFAVALAAAVAVPRLRRVGRGRP
jgi:nitrous oxidase accessory protein